MRAEIVSKKNNYYDILSDICTTLVIGESEGFLLVPDVIPRLREAMNEDGENGDVLVMAARAMSLLLENFRETIRMLSDEDIEAIGWCFMKISGIVSRSVDGVIPLAFSVLTEQDLIEELLKNISLGLKETLVVDLLPPVSEQLRFCQSTMSCSLWIACKALHHCMLLLRSEQLCSAKDICILQKMVVHHLVSLEKSSKIDFDWEELLRAVTYCVVTMRRRKSPASKTVLARKRQRNASLSEGTDGSPNSSTLDESNFSELVTLIFLRILTSIGKSAPDARIQLILACVDTVMEKPLEAILGEESLHVSAIKMLHDLLRTQVKVNISFSDPFSAGNNPHDAIREHLDEETGANALPNLQWNLPSMSWCTMTVLAKLLGGNAVVEKEYLWAYRGGHDTYFLFRPKHRALLSQKFFSGEKKVCLQGKKLHVDLVQFTNRVSNPIFGPAVSPIHFQPVPFSQKYSGRALHGNTRGERLACELLQLYSNASDLKEVLKLLSYGVSPAAELSKMIYFFLVCCGNPEDTEETKAPFREIIATRGPEEVEQITAWLLGKDPLWSRILLDVGVAEAISGSGGGAARLSPAPERHSAHTLLKKPIRVPISPSPPGDSRKRVSPVLEQLQSSLVKSHPSPEPLSCLPPTTESITKKLREGCREAMHQFIEECSRSTVSVETVRSVLSGLTKGRSILVSLLESFLSKTFQEMALQGRQQLLVPTVIQFDGSVYVCHEETDVTSSKCPQGHSLCIYHGMHWKCNNCQNQTAYASYACRQCDYDLCCACLEKSSRCLPVSCTATVANVAKSWIDLIKAEKKPIVEDRNVPSHGLPSTSADGRLLTTFTSTGVLPAVTPAHLHRHLHVEISHQRCLCRAKRPRGLYRSEIRAAETSLSILLDTLGAELVQKLGGGPLAGLFSAMEGIGTAIALRGVVGLPPRLQEIIAGLTRHIPCLAKRQMARFLSVECRRCALKVLDEAQICFPGAVHDDMESRGLYRKVEVPRNDQKELTEALFKTFYQNIPVTSKVEFSFKGEVGTGNGPTQEVYAELSRLYSFAEESGTSSLWYRRDDGVHFPCPSNTQVFHKEFFVFGAACARGFVDDYLVEFDLLPSVWGVIREGASVSSFYHRNATDSLMEVLQTVDPQLFSSYRAILRASAEELERMELEDEKGTPVTPSCAAMYIEKLLLSHFQSTLENIHYFLLGLSTGIDLNAFWFVSNEELCEIFCGTPRDDDEEKKLFTEEDLQLMVEAAHGYEADSPIVAMLISIVGAKFSRREQTYFLEFLTGSTRLPLNGLRGLNRKITVVKKEMDGKGEETLPSCSTCFLYLKLPPYSSEEVMRERLLYAVTEGRRNFSLS